MKFKFDIDDTILFSEIDENGEYHLKNYDRYMVEAINNLVISGHNVIIETGRHWNHLNITISQLKSIGLLYDTLIMGKPPVDYDIDDKNLSPNEFMQLYNKGKFE